MPLIKTIPAAFVLFLCLFSQSLAAYDFDYYSLELMWPPASCYESSAGCCLPTMGRSALDFFITGLQTRDGISGEEVEVSKCKQSNFYFHEVVH